MVDVWRNIDPSEAESRLDSLYRRLSDLDEAIQSQTAALAADPQSFAFQLTRDSLLIEQRSLQQALYELLQHRVNEAIELHLNGPNFTEHTADFTTLGLFLQRFQRLFTSVSHALLKDPTKRGPIPLNIEQLASIRVASFMPGSFGIIAVAPSRTDLAGDNPVVMSLERLFEFINSDPADDAFLLWATELGSRSISHYRRLLTFMASTQTVPSLEWRNPSGIQKVWRPNYDLVLRLQTRMNSILEEYFVDRVYEGRLMGASLLKRTFEFLSEDSVISGKVSIEAMAKIALFFGKECEIEVSVSQYVDKVTDEERTSTTMIDIRLPRSARTIAGEG